jgi:hypothetical protein
LAAADPGLQLHVAEAQELRVGDRAVLDVSLDLPANAAAPLLLTQTVEGEAVEVVRGRLMRKDARDPNARQLHFDVPLLARAPGTSIVRVHALVYVCQAQCEAVELEKRVSIAVLAAR